MPDSPKPVAHLDDLAVMTSERGSGYQSEDRFISPVLGLSKIGATLTEVQPGKSACPFHVHHVEDELFIILEGEGTYRFGSETYAVRAGDCLGAPAGDASKAHKLTNTGKQVLKYLALSSRAKFDVCEYPDSGKFMVRSDRGTDTPFRHIGRTEANLDYWDGEPDS